jgi:CDP-glycerol glycerophosphotransferase (TagB/SpsB family)
MMSKMEYGVQANKVVQIINQCAMIKNTKLVIKPHTRGMDIAEIKHLVDGSVINAEKHSSSEVIQWADIVLFTGSSIIFEAMILEKRVLYLAALQKYRSIFDDLPGIAKFNGNRSIEAALNMVQDQNYPHARIRDFVIEHAYHREPSGDICANFVDLLINQNKNVISDMRDYK